MIACCMSFFMMQPLLIVLETAVPALRSCWWVAATLAITVCFFVGKVSVHSTASLSFLCLSDPHTNTNKEPMLTVCGRGIVE